MPVDENGDKWACEPCIRGHRSSRCEHFDRFMVRVARPGRPLSTCPHPKNQCNCGREKVMMIRIPKASTCICAPLYTLGPDNKPLASFTAIDTSGRTDAPFSQPLQSPSVSAPHRIQKASQRSGSIIVPEAIARGLQYEAESAQSYAKSPSTLTRSGMSSAISDQLSISNSSEELFPSGVGPRPLSPDGNGIGGTTQPSLQLSMMGIGGYRAGKDEVGWNGEWPSLQEQHGHENMATPTQQHVPQGCCSSHRATPQPLPVTTTTSCCSSHPIPATGPSPSITPKYAPPPPPVVYQHPAAPYHLSQTPAQTTLYTIPPPYATASHPLTVQQLTYLQQNPHLYSQTVSQSATLGIVGQAAPPAGAGGQVVPMAAHNCNCGASCECLGCAAHPFNATTRSHVQSLGAILAHGERDDAPSPAVGGYDAIGHQPFDPGPAGVSMAAAASATTTGPPWPPSSSEAEDIPLFSSSAYYTYSMEFPTTTTGGIDAALTMPPTSAQTCTDVSGSCKCGDDCACIGCLTHLGHNGISLGDVVGTSDGAPPGAAGGEGPV